MRTLFPPVTAADLADMERRARRLGAANCWTGTGGSVAADSLRLIDAYRRQCEALAVARGHSGDKSQPAGAK
jgi:hypothetical protein